MARLVVSQFITTDGVVEDPGGSEGRDFGGWAFKYDRGDDGDRFKVDEVMASDALLLGRTTYEGFAEAWPSREGDFADKFGGGKPLLEGDPESFGLKRIDTQAVGPDGVVVHVYVPG